MCLKKLFFILGVSLVQLISCTKKENDMPTFLSETNITYRKHTSRIIANRCVGCHNNPGGNGVRVYDLRTYTDVINNLSLIEERALNDTTALGPMPPIGSFWGMLTPMEKDTLRKWIEQGAIE